MLVKREQIQWLVISVSAYHIPQIPSRSLLPPPPSFTTYIEPFPSPRPSVATPPVEIAENFSPVTLATVSIPVSSPIISVLSESAILSVSI